MHPRTLLEVGRLADKRARQGKGGKARGLQITGGAKPPDKTHGTTAPKSKTPDDNDRWANVFIFMEKGNRSLERSLDSLLRSSAPICRGVDHLDDVVPYARPVLRIYVTHVSLVGETDGDARTALDWCRGAVGVAKWPVK
jgi:hypothetical protein